MSEADLARDLEAELLSDLQATLAAAKPAQEPEDDTPYTDEAYYAGEYEPEAEEPFYDGEEPAAEPEATELEEDLYYGAVEEPAPPPPEPAPKRGFQPRALPRGITDSAAADRAFASLNLRAPPAAPGPAYNPTALAPAPYQSAPPPVESLVQWTEAEPDPVEDTHPFDAVARQGWDSDVAPSSQPHAPIGDEGLFPVEDFDSDMPRTQEPQRIGRDFTEDYGIVAEDLAAHQPLRTGGRRRIATIAGVIIFVGLAGAAMVFLRGGNSGSATPPLIVADASPVRIMPAANTAPIVDRPGDAVFERMNPAEGNNTPETLAPIAETPIVAAPPAPGDGITQMLLPAAGGIQPVAPPPLDDEPRTVRTVTVLPDGTIVNNDVVPANGAAPAAAAANADAPAALAEPVNVTPAPVAAIPTPVPAAPVATAGAPTTGRAGAAIPPGAYVQLSSQTSEQAALTDITNFRTQVPSILGSLNAVVQTGVVNGIPRFRVQFGPFASDAEANTMCNRLRSAGVAACIIARN